MAKQRVFIFEGDVRPIEKLGTHLLHHAGLELQTVNAEKLEDVVSTDTARMFQQAHAWACKVGGFVSAFPTFLSTGEHQREEHPLVLLTSDVAERIDVTDAELWSQEPDATKWDHGHFFRVVHDVCWRRGFATGYPTFMHTPKDGRRTQHLVALKRSHALQFNLELPDVARAPFLDVRHIFSTVNRWAQEQGYAAGLANFHLRVWERGWGERHALSRAEQDLNHLLQNEGWRIVRVDPLKVSATRDGLAYLLEKD